MNKKDQMIQRVILKLYLFLIETLIELLLFALRILLIMGY